MCPTTLGTGVRGRIAEQQHKNTARHIVGSLQTWDLNPDLAARRWVWELLQNAADTATANHRQLTLTFTLTPNSLTFEHNGGPFRDQDLAALILAGSAKPFDNSPYVGRFGTGFLVTHAISKYVLVSGKAEGYPGGFSIALDRRGSEDEIRTQIDHCYDQLDQEQPTTAFFARFEYKNMHQAGYEVASKGLRLLDELLPYIFAFNPLLQTVVINSEGLTAHWERGLLNDEPE